MQILQSLGNQHIFTFMCEINLFPTQFSPNSFLCYREFRIKCTAINKSNQTAAKPPSLHCFCQLHVLPHKTQCIIMPTSAVSETGAGIRRSSKSIDDRFRFFQRASLHVAK